MAPRVQKLGVSYIDFELIRVYSRFVDMNCLDEDAHKLCRMAITDMNMVKLASILNEKVPIFCKEIQSSIIDEAGQKFLESITQIIIKNIQLRIDNFLGA